MLLGLRTVIYPAPDLEAAKRFYTAVLGVPPYFDQPFYVGFNPGGFELGLDPDPARKPGLGGPVAYWGVDNAEAAHARLLELGATATEGVREVGGDIKVATVFDPFGNPFAIIEDPHYAGPAQQRA